jgi:hypothetical protein
MPNLIRLPKVPADAGLKTISPEKTLDARLRCGK